MENKLLFKYVCDYILENITTYQLINVAIECITAGMECENLCILAGLSENDDIIRYYKLTLNELNIKEPNKEEAGKYLIKYYCKELLENKISSNMFLQKIKYEIYDKTGKDNKIVGDYFKIEIIISLFYEINDIKYDKKYNKNIEKELNNECYKMAEEYINNCI